MGVGAENHLAAACVHFTHVLMDDADVGRDEDAAILFTCRETENVVIFIDGTAHRAEAVVAAGENIGQREAVKAGGPCGLDDADIGQIVAGDGVKFDFQIVRIAAHIVALQDTVSDGPFFGLPAVIGESLLRLLRFHQDFSLQQIHAGILKLYHKISPVPCFLKPVFCCFQDTKGERRSEIHSFHGRHSRRELTVQTTQVMKL